MAHPLILALLAVTAPPDYAVSRFEAPARLAEEGAAMQTLLINALDRRGVVVGPARSTMPCSQAGCASEIAQADGVTQVIVGSLQPFGQKLLVTAAVYSSDEEAFIPGRYDATIDTVNDLDAAAKRIASAIVSGGDTESNQELGAIYELETEPDRRRRGRSSFSLNLGGILPIENTYGDASGGLSFAIGYWYEGRDFALEASLGFRFSADGERQREFFEVPLDIAGYYILSLGDFAPFIGLGAGPRWMYAARPGTIEVGSVITTQNEGQIDDSGFGFGGFVRLGVMLLRTYTVSVSISGRYTVNFWDFNDAGFPQAGLFEVQIYF